MKKYILYIIVIACAWILGACERDFLDTKPLTQLTEVAFFQTPADIEEALVGCYYQLSRAASNNGQTPVIMDDQANAGFGSNDNLDFRVIQHFDMTIAPGLVNLQASTWSSSYKTLFNVNLLLQKLNDVDWSNNPGRKTEIEAELRYMRAITYFDLVRYFEKVVLLTKPSSENLAQSEPDETYNLIADDLLFAAENAPGAISSKAKVTKWAAKALIARVYLFYTGYYQKSDLVGKITKPQSLLGLEDIIQSGNFKLVPVFKNLFWVPSAVLNATHDNWNIGYAGKDNSEVVFAYRFNITSGNNNGMVTNNGMRGKSYPPYGYGWGGLTVRKEFYQSFEANDPRREASIVALNEEGYGPNNSDQRDYTGYATKKYIPLVSPDGKTDQVTSLGASWMNNQFQDYVYMRYADVLLMAAELGSPNAQQYFDTIRDRVGLPHKPVSFINIMNERKFEFAFEGPRYWDLMRQGVDVLAASLAYDGMVLDGGTPYHKVIKAENIISKRGFQQIPQDQINISNGVLKQNPGW